MSNRYISQTGRTFKTRYKKHTTDTKSNGQYSKFAQYIIDTCHAYDTMENIMNILRTEKKSEMLTAYERLYIYEARKQGTQLNDTLTEGYNPIYDIILASYPT
jgi:endonuclease IV